MSKEKVQAIWVSKSVEDTQKIYADWAENYDSDVTEWGYATPGRIAEALAPRIGDTTLPVLDFGCGTGISGVALKQAGFQTIDGMDISQEMLELARPKALYRDLRHAEPGTVKGVTPGDYAAIVAAGVISIGAAPPETLSIVLNHLAPGGLLAFSFNDPTFEAGTYEPVLAQELAAGRAEMLFREHGPHLPEKNMESTVFILRRL
ncbi:MAG: methyltransferase domain-containing protein [Pseudomonadota bacterium]